MIRLFYLTSLLKKQGDMHSLSLDRGLTKKETMHKHDHCEHKNVKFCSHCNVVYCEACNEEFKKPGITTVTGTGTWPNVTITPFRYDTPNVLCGGATVSGTNNQTITSHSNH